MSLWLVENAITDEDGDAVRVAAWLARAKTRRVCLAGPRPLGPQERENLGRVKLADELTGPAEVALLDVWTAETDERVVRLREQGVRTSCLADLLLQRRRAPMVGVTGTAGKSTTAWLLRQLLATQGTVCSSAARADNLWPTSRLLRCGGKDHTVVELTSSHLAFCHHSPRVAAITNFWPDHIELHGSEEAYAAAKARLFRWQKAEDWAVLPADDQAATCLAQNSPARRAFFAESAPPEAEIRVWNEGEQLRIDFRGISKHRLLPREFDQGQRRRSLLCALATALAAVEAPNFESLLAVVDRLALPPHRNQLLSPPDSPWLLVDDTLAATPSKALAALRPGCHLVAGGFLESGGRRVHQSAEERRKLSAWIEAAREQCAGIEVFGGAGRWLAEQWGLATSHEHVLQALVAAVSRAGPDQRVVVSPGFPMAQPDREAVAAYMRSPRGTTPFSTRSKKP